jgi:hypothetical protein
VSAIASFILAREITLPMLSLISSGATVLYRCCIASVA